MKAKIGFYCTKCNHKVADRQVDSRTERTGVCRKCHNEYHGTMAIRLNPGQSSAHLTTMLGSNTDIIYPVLTNQTEEEIKIMKHTPAPWTASRSFSPARINKVSANRVFIADCWTSERTPEEQEANARLIAAAPELLDVLQNWFETRTTEERIEWMHAARAAIAKATA